MKQESSDRILWVDFLRGVAMLLVIWGHLDTSEESFFLWTNAIKLPLFFAISGFLIDFDRCDSKQFIIGKIKRLLLPYYFLGGLSVTISVLKDYLTNRYFNYDLILSFLLGKEFWFIPCLFVCMFLIFIFSIIASRNPIMVYWISIIVGVLGGLLLSPNRNLPYRVDLALYVQMFVCFGNFLKKRNEIINSYKILLLSIIVYIITTLLFCNIIPNYGFDLNLELFSNLPLCTFHMLLGIILAFTAFREIGKLEYIIVKFVRYVGKNTIVFFVLSFQCMHVSSSIVRYFINLCGINCSHLIINLIVFIALCIELSILSFFIERYFPILLGKRKVRK